MSSSFDKLNLRPNERRLLVAVATVVFFVLNIWLVWPHFKDWGQRKTKMKVAQEKLETYRAEINQIPEYDSRVKKLMGEEKIVLPEDEALQLLKIVTSQAAQSGVVLGQVNSRESAKTNAGFVERTQQIILQQAGEKQLVDFLYKLGNANSMIRVRDLSLRPDASRMQLGGSITLVASYQRKAAAPATRATAAAAATTPAAKTLQPTEKRAAPPDKRVSVTNRVSITNKPTTMPDRRPKPADKPAT